MVRWLMTMMMMTAVSSCGGQGHAVKTDHAPVRGSAKDEPAEPLLADSDLNPGPGLRQLTPDALRQSMDGGDDFALSDQSASLDPEAGMGGEGLRPAGDGCIDEVMRRLTVHAKGDTAVVSGHLDLGKCLASELATPSAEVLAAEESVRVYLQISCVGSSLDAFDGKTYGDLVAAGDHPCANAQAARIVSQTDDTQLARLRRQTPAGPVTVEEGRRRLHAEIGPDGGPCRYDLQGGRFVRSSCADVTRELITRSRSELGGTVTVNPDEGKEDFLRLEQLPASLKVTRNNWKGEVTLDPAGGKPRWRMQDAAGTVVP